MLHPVHPLPIPILKYVLKDKQVATALTVTAASRLPRLQLHEPITP